MLHHGRHSRPDDKCQDPFSLKAAKSGLFVPIFLLASPQKRFPLQSFPQYKAFDGYSKEGFALSEAFLNKQYVQKNGILYLYGNCLKTVYRNTISKNKKRRPKAAYRKNNSA